MLNKVFTTSVLAFGLFILATPLTTAHANVCSLLFETAAKQTSPTPIELAKNSGPLQQEYNELTTAAQQLQFIKNKVQHGYLLVEVAVGKHVRVAPSTTYSSGVKFLLEYRYYLFDSIKNAHIIVDMTNNQFVPKDNYGHAIKVNFKNTTKILEFFSGLREKVPWTPQNLNFASRMKLNISSYPTPGYWKIDNAPGFQDYEVGSFYLRVYRDSRANLKPVAKPAAALNHYKLRKLNQDI
jgi:hypothetical protein